MSATIRASLRHHFQRRLHPSIQQNGEIFTVKIEVDRLRLPKQSVAEAQHKHKCCIFDSTHLTMEGTHEDLSACIVFLAENEENPLRQAGARDGRGRVPKSAVLR
ncbi:MAG: hypothetical protein UR94_C0004G0009 [Parcubacteria group bacterium GW2011_GWA2_36_10]|nr:MAG: hypothetical protein UR94_C0004G0009 [Parcubacteria group bacterium GW2011_GWA2_36_10]